MILETIYLCADMINVENNLEVVCLTEIFETL